MTNLAYAVIDKTDEYIDLEDELDVTFVDDTTYKIQIQNTAMLCEADDQPDEGGFLINNTQIFEYTHKNSKLWLKAISKAITINIAG